jgi:[ribosomal protein S18]-alanine N-acetyltransferase
MTADITIRAATLGDLAQLMALAELCAEAPQWPRSVWQQVLRTEGGADQRVVFLAESGGAATGFSVLSFTDDFGEIESLAVHPAMRRQGIGRSLCERMLDHARQWGAARVLLEVRVTNEAARRLYGVLGFEERGLRKRYYRNPDEDAVAMAILVERF